MKAISVAISGSGSFNKNAFTSDDSVLFDSPWLFLAGKGLISRFDPHEATRHLASIVCDNQVGLPGSGVIAFGALPFELGQPGQMAIFQTTFGQDESGHRWMTLILEDKESIPNSADLQKIADESLSYVDHSQRTDNVGSFNLDESIGYKESVEKAIEAIRLGEIDKVVLARSLDVTFTNPIDPANVISRLCDQEPTCTTFSLPSLNGLFLGASPELLVSIRGNNLVCRPLAGTIGLTGDSLRDEKAISELVSSAKDHAEHQYVVDEIVRTLRPLCSNLYISNAPTPIKFHFVAHLETTIEGALCEELSVVDIVLRLHPTPAVGGVPRAKALELIAELEPSERGLWAGPVGWIDTNHNGDWVVGIRSMTLAPNRLSARLLAGAGIVESSDSESEFNETTLKLAPVLDALMPSASTQIGNLSIKEDEL